VSVRIRKHESRLNHATLVLLDEKEFWDRPVLPDLPTSTGDRYHIVQAEERIDNIARKYYRNERLWWVIAHANDLRYLPDDLHLGNRIRIPDPSVVRKYLLI
jgi:nucleoid-associated protein YgaU